MTLATLEAAERDLHEATDYYDARQPGLGVRFLAEASRLAVWIEKNATIPRLRRGGYRRVNMKLFPYYIAYAIRGDTIMILAVAHAHRKPGYWLQRMAR